MQGERVTLASLPMYDWPEVRASVDALWRSIELACAERVIDVPADLTRVDDPETVWRDPACVVSQTCGLPLVLRLSDVVEVLGTFVFDLPDTEPGDYHSVVIVPTGSEAVVLEDLRGATVAFNGADSQSGCAALLHVLAPLAVDGGFFGATVETGTHRGSIVAVAEGRADVAAIDAVSWELAVDHEPAAAEVRVLARTPPVPGLPLITAIANADRRHDLVDAIAAGVGDLEPEHRATLHLEGFRPRTLDDYSVIDDRLRQARADGYGELG